MVRTGLTLTAVVILASIFSVTKTKKDPLPYGDFPHNYDTDEEVKKKYNTDSYKFDGQI